MKKRNPKITKYDLYSQLSSLLEINLNEKEKSLFDNMKKLKRSIIDNLLTDIANELNALQSANIEEYGVSQLVQRGNNVAIQYGKAIINTPVVYSESLVSQIQPMTILEIDRYLKDAYGRGVTSDLKKNIEQQANSLLIRKAREIDPLSVIDFDISTQKSLLGKVSTDKQKKQIQSKLKGLMDMKKRKNPNSFISDIYSLLSYNLKENGYKDSDRGAFSYISAYNNNNDDVYEDFGVVPNNELQKILEKFDNVDFYKKGVKGNIERIVNLNYKKGGRVDVDVKIIEEIIQPTHVSPKKEVQTTDETNTTKSQGIKIPTLENVPSEFKNEYKLLREFLKSLFEISSWYQYDTKLYKNFKGRPVVSFEVDNNADLDQPYDEEPREGEIEDDNMHRLIEEEYQNAQKEYIEQVISKTGMKNLVIGNQVSGDTWNFGTYEIFAKESRQNPNHNWIQGAFKEIDDKGTEGAFTRYCKDEFGATTVKQRIKCAKTIKRKYEQGIGNYSKKTYRRAIFYLNIVKASRKNPHDEDFILVLNTLLLNPYSEAYNLSEKERALYTYFSDHFMPAIKSIINETEKLTHNAVLEKKEKEEKARIERERKEEEERKAKERKEEEEYQTQFTSENKNIKDSLLMPSLRHLIQEVEPNVFETTTDFKGKASKPIKLQLIYDYDKNRFRIKLIDDERLSKEDFKLFKSYLGMLWSRRDQEFSSGNKKKNRYLRDFEMEVLGMRGFDDFRSMPAWERQQRKNEEDIELYKKLEIAHQRRLKEDKLIEEIKKLTMTQRYDDSLETLYENLRQQGGGKNTIDYIKQSNAQNFSAERRGKSGITMKFKHDYSSKGHTVDLRDTIYLDADIKKINNEDNWFFTYTIFDKDLNIIERGKSTSIDEINKDLAMILVDEYFVYFDKIADEYFAQKESLSDLNVDTERVTQKQFAKALYFYNNEEDISADYSYDFVMRRLEDRLKSKFRYLGYKIPIKYKGQKGFIKIQKGGYKGTPLDKVIEYAKKEPKPKRVPSSKKVVSVGMYLELSVEKSEEFPRTVFSIFNPKTDYGGIFNGWKEMEFYDEKNQKTIISTNPLLNSNGYRTICRRAFDNQSKGLHYAFREMLVNFKPHKQLLDTKNIINFEKSTFVITGKIDNTFLKFLNFRYNVLDNKNLSEEDMINKMKEEYGYFPFGITNSFSQTWYERYASFRKYKVPYEFPPVAISVDFKGVEIEIDYEELLLKTKLPVDYLYKVDDYKRNDYR